MTQVDQLKRVNEVIELARELFIHTEALSVPHALQCAEDFLKQTNEYRKEKRKAIIAGKEVYDAR